MAKSAPPSPYGLLRDTRVEALRNQLAVLRRCGTGRAYAVSELALEFEQASRQAQAGAKLRDYRR